MEHLCGRGLRSVRATVLLVGLAFGLAPVASAQMNWTVRSDPVMSVIGGTVILDNDVFRTWQNGGAYNVVKAESTDGINWSAWDASCSLHPPGSAHHGSNATVVIKDGLYWLWEGETSSAPSVYVYTSPDGCDWTLIGTVVEHWWQYTVRSTESGFEAWVQIFPDSSTCYTYATSTDGVTWAYQGCTLEAGGSGAYDESLGSPEVLYFAGQNHMWYRANGGTESRFAYATSPDGLVWEKHGLVNGFDQIYDNPDTDRDSVARKRSPGRNNAQDVVSH